MMSTLEELIEEGKAAGRTEGELKGNTNALLALLEARGLSVPKLS